MEKFWKKGLHGGGLGSRVWGVPRRSERSSVVEPHLAKVVVVGSNPIARSNFFAVGRGMVLAGEGGGGVGWGAKTEEVLVKDSHRGGFTLIELLVVIAIIGLLAAILVPAITMGMDRARRSACLNNVKELTEGFLSYASDHKGRLPGPNSGGCDDLTAVAKLMYTDGYVTLPAVWVCPSDKGRKAFLGSKFEESFTSEANCSYIYFAGYNSLKAADDLSKLPLVADRAQGNTLTAADAHGEKYRNVGYLGGVVKGLRTADEANGITELALLKDEKYKDVEIFQ